MERIDRDERSTWGPKEKSQFIKEWHDRGFEDPPVPWTEYDIRHIAPRENGGGNEFENLVPVKREVHKQQFNPWWIGVQ